jgi:hypothetical protein
MVKVSVRELAVVEPDWELIVAQRFWSPVFAPEEDPEKLAAVRLPVALIVPATLNFARGFVVPIPTLPELLFAMSLP